MENGLSEQAGANETFDPIPVLTLQEVTERLHSNRHPASSRYRAMYSSWVGGFTTDPAAMVLPLDDHMVHRGHSVFDTAVIWNGWLYQLDPHIDRLLRSARKAGITPCFSREQLRHIVINLAAVSGLQAGSVRYYLSAGPGGFNLSPKECVTSTFYGVAIDDSGDDLRAEPIKVVTTSVPIKDRFFATVKSTNYLQNALVMAEAISKGAYTGVWVDEEGCIAEAPNMNVAFVSGEGVLLVPDFARILDGCTAKRMLDLLKGEGEGTIESVREIARQVKSLIKRVEVRKIPLEEARTAKEMFCVCSGVLISPIIEWDGRPVGGGVPGSVTTALLQMLQRDRDSSPSPHRIKLPVSSP
eukprot:TRINITY_DN15966_c0_g1_i1.p1 TRINITY_DN15966_c0_g1~~TRINITY_DN15966_c0_g1_i1.p1  ORF type:complete len:356 (+),score=78.43 TRINITY_DN15966_c0_g1_i1:161-1228(+)